MSLHVCGGSPTVDLLGVRGVPHGACSGKRRRPAVCLGRLPSHDRRSRARMTVVDRRLLSASTACSRPALRVSVVVPARNEARNLPHVLPRIPASCEVVLVDGHSVDETVKAARRCRSDIKVIRQTRTGKGNALACGFAAATGDVIVMLDADGSTDPAEIPEFVEALLAGADVAKGTRFARGGSSTDITRLRRFGNSALNGLVNLLFGTDYSDLCYGYNAFWAYMLPVLDLPPTDASPFVAGMSWGDGFEIETLINVRVAVAGARITEVGSVERDRIHGASNLNAVHDGLRVLRTIVHEKRRAGRAALHAHEVRPHIIDLRAAFAPVWHA
jgi:glycosyltransferase involved in cell wall biosynthesis